MTARQGLVARDVVLAEVLAKYAPAIRRGLAVVVAWAEKGGSFSANDVREDMIDAHVPGPARGHTFRIARENGIIRQLPEWETSTDPGTHGKPLPRYVSARRPVPHRSELVEVPTKRDATGRFSTADHVVGQTDLFAELGIDA